MALVGTEEDVTLDLRVRRERWGYDCPVVPGEEVRSSAHVVAEQTGS